MIWILVVKLCMYRFTINNVEFSLNNFLSVIPRNLRSIPLLIIYQVFYPRLTSNKNILFSITLWFYFAFLCITQFRNLQVGIVHVWGIGWSLLLFLDYISSNFMSIGIVCIFFEVNLVFCRGWVNLVSCRVFSVTSIYSREYNLYTIN